MRLSADPLVDGPIIPSCSSSPSDDDARRGHQNINGPSLIRVPEWIDRPRGRYYLYFADHKGARIELAYSNELSGPWTVHDGGVLHLRETPFLQEAPALPQQIDRVKLGVPRAPGVPSLLDDCTIPHIASPDVVIDDESRSIRLYYHGLDAFGTQLTRLAVSSDGLRFAARDEILSPPYLRMFRYREWWYGIAMPGGIFRSRDGLSHFESGPVLFDANMRHAGVWLREDSLWIFWTRVGDAPERILLSTVDLHGDWMSWRESAEVEVHRPTHPWEGVDRPVEPSVRSSVDHPVNQLRDPYLYVEGDAQYLVYAVAGESGLAISRLEVQATTGPRNTESPRDATARES